MKTPEWPQIRKWAEAEIEAATERLIAGTEGGDLERGHIRACRKLLALPADPNRDPETRVGPADRYV